MSELLEYLARLNGEHLDAGEVRKEFGKARAQMRDYPAEFTARDLIHYARRRGWLQQEAEGGFVVSVEFPG